MAGRQLGDGGGEEVKTTRGADSSIKAGQRKPGLETISKLSTRGSRGEDKSWSGNKDTRKLCVALHLSQCVCLYSCKHLSGLSQTTWSRLGPSDLSLWVAEASPDGFQRAKGPEFYLDIARPWPCSCMRLPGGAHGHAGKQLGSPSCPKKRGEPNADGQQRKMLEKQNGFCGASQAVGQRDDKAATERSH